MPREMDNALRNEVSGILYDIGTDNFQIDEGDDAIDEVEGGCWVKVWVWVADEECAMCDDDGHQSDNGGIVCPRCNGTKKPLSLEELRAARRGAK